MKASENEIHFLELTTHRQSPRESNCRLPLSGITEVSVLIPTDAFQDTFSVIRGETDRKGACRRKPTRWESDIPNSRGTVD